MATALQRIREILFFFSLLLPPYCSLDMNCLLLTHICNTWPQLVVLSGKVSQPLGDGALS